MDDLGHLARGEALGLEPVAHGEADEAVHVVQVLVVLALGDEGVALEGAEGAGPLELVVGGGQQDLGNVFLSHVAHVLEVVGGEGAVAGQVVEGDEPGGGDGVLGLAVAAEVVEVLAQQRDEALVAGAAVLQVLGDVDADLVHEGGGLLDGQGQRAEELEQRGDGVLAAVDLVRVQVQAQHLGRLGGVELAEAHHVGRAHAEPGGDLVVARGEEQRAPVAAREVLVQRGLGRRGGGGGGAVVAAAVVVVGGEEARVVGVIDNHEPGELARAQGAAHRVLGVDDLAVGGVGGGGGVVVEEAREAELAADGAEAIVEGGGVDGAEPKDVAVGVFVAHAEGGLEGELGLADAAEAFDGDALAGVGAGAGRDGGEEAVE